MTILKTDRQTDRQDIASVDIVKFFLAICIVFIHGNGLTFLPDFWNYFVEKFVLRVAVPFFFVSSGYFLRITLDKGKSIKSYCLRLLKPLIVFELLNTLLQEAINLKNGTGLVEVIYDAIKHILFYPYGAMWFLQACIVGALLLYIFYKREKLRWGFAVGLALYCFALLCNNYYFLVQGNGILETAVKGYMQIFLSARNGLFVGLLFLSMGFLIHDWKLASKKNILVIMGCLLAIYAFEILLIYDKNTLDDGALFVTHILLIPCIFCCVLNIHVNMASSVSVLLRNLSTGIYMLHRLLLTILGYLLASFVMNWLKCLLVILIAIAICLIVYKKKREPFYSLLK